MHKSRRPELLERSWQLLEARASKIFLALLLIMSVLPVWSLEVRLRPLLLAAFGIVLVIRGLCLWQIPMHRSRAEYLFLGIDAVVLVSFLPIRPWLPMVGVTLLHLSRLAALLRFAKDVAIDLISIMTRREQLEQFVLVTIGVIALAFGSAVILSQLDVPYDYNSLPDAPDRFVDRLWWAFRQLESADNLVPHLAVNPIVAVISFGLTVIGVFIISFIIGIGANVVDQVVRAERRRPIRYRGHSLIIGAVEPNELVVKEFVRLYDKNRLLRRLSLMEVIDWLTAGGPPPRRHALPYLALMGPGRDLPHYLFEPMMRWVVYRQGDGADLSDLGRVAACHAKRAILLADNEHGYDADAVTVASLAAFRKVNPTAHVFVEVLESHNCSVVQCVGEGGTFPLDVSRFLGLFLCQHLMIPGIESLYQDLLTADGSEFYTHVFLEDEALEALERLGRDGYLEFEDLARCAYLEHHVLLNGVLLGEGRPPRLPGYVVPIDSFVQWLNPAILPEDPRVAELGGRPGRIPVRSLRGLIGVAESYSPMRHYARELLKGRGERRAEGSSRLAAGEDRSDALLAGARLERQGPRRVLLVGYSRALPALLRELARYSPGIDVVLVIGERPDSKMPLWERLESLELGLDRLSQLPGLAGLQFCLEHGGHVTLHTHEGPDLASFAVRCLGQAPVDAAVFLSEPHSVDRDARTGMRVLHFVRALDEGRAPRGDRLHLLAEFGSLEKGERIKQHLNGRRCGFSDDFQLELTFVSTDQIKNYFMVHSAFVPGVTSIYREFLGAGGQEILRILLPPPTMGSPTYLRLADLYDPLRRRAALPMGLELSDGRVVLNPPPDRQFLAAQVSGVYVLGDFQALEAVFPAGGPADQATPALG